MEKERANQDKNDPEAMKTLSRGQVSCHCCGMHMQGTLLFLAFLIRQHNSLRISLFFFLPGSWQLVGQMHDRAQIYLQCFIYTNFYFVPSQNIEYQAEVKKIEVEHQAALEALRRLFQSYPITVFRSLSFMLEQWPVYRRGIFQNLTDQTQNVSWQSRQEPKIFRFVTRGN